MLDKIYDLLIAGGAWQTILEGLWATVQIETGARAMALSSGKVDAVFWTRSVTCKECNKTFAENIEGTLVTESYFVEQQAFVIPKSDK